MRRVPSNEETNLWHRIRERPNRTCIRFVKKDSVWPLKGKQAEIDE